MKAVTTTALLLPNILLSIAFQPSIGLVSIHLVGKLPQRITQLPLTVVGASSSSSTPSTRGGGDHRSGDCSPAKGSAVARFIDMSVSLIGSTTSAAVSLTFFGFLAWQRDALMVTFFIGSIGNGILSKLLKRIINQTRPAELASRALIQRKPTDNGMPSSHAMSLGFIATFTSLCAPWAATPLALYTLISLYYRIQVNLHTWQQVIVGLSVGSMNGYLWHRWCHTTALLDWVRETCLDAHSGLLPVPMLIVPIVLGAVTVGSLERRLGDLFAWRTPRDR
jgi:membrane-associated phospholipid phosphatase